MVSHFLSSFISLNSFINSLLFSTHLQHVTYGLQIVLLGCAFFIMCFKEPSMFLPFLDNQDYGFLGLSQSCFGGSSVP